MTLEVDIVVPLFVSQRVSLFHIIETRVSMVNENLKQVRGNRL
tara:strand:+ start:53645 stop:53773 length:129 start_codon:yes stop_codon:yes gene_type:complete